MKWGGWDVAEDGTLSLDGVTRFPIYGANGLIQPGRYITARLLDREKRIVDVTAHDELEELVKL